MSAKYRLAGNAERHDPHLVFSPDPPVYSVLRLEDELIWHFPQGIFNRGVGGTVSDRHFDDTEAVVIGIAQPELEDTSL